MKTLVHFGCSFAVGNGVPKYLKGLESGKLSHLHGVKFKEKYGMNPQKVQSSGSVLAKSLKLNHVTCAENGASNEMIARRLLQTRLHRNFVLIGLTSYNRRLPPVKITVTGTHGRWLIQNLLPITKTCRLLHSYAMKKHYTPRPWKPTGRLEQ